MVRFLIYYKRPLHTLVRLHLNTQNLWDVIRKLGDLANEKIGA